MSPWLTNLAAWSTQVAVIVPLAILLPRAFRISAPGPLLAWRQAVLLACLILPFVQPRQVPELAEVTVVQTSTLVHTAGSDAPAFNFMAAVPWILGTGAAVRLCWIALGLLRLRQYRLRASLLENGARAEVLVSDHVSGPVTFGFFRPVVLVPAAFRGMSADLRRSILYHEFTHVERRDWAVVLMEEIVRAVLWFHPAIWWLLGQVHLAREQVVDLRVIERTGERQPYLEALLAVAGGQLRPDLAPAPLFLKKRHLAERVAVIVKEVVMSKRRLFVSLAGVVSAVSLATWFVVLQFPLQAPAQTVRSGGDNLLHRTPIEYPRAAMERGVQGTVIVRATLDEKGNVTDAQVVSGPEILRRSALRSVLDWHYSRSAGSPSTVDVAIDFTLPAARGGSPASTEMERRKMAQKMEAAGIEGSSIRSIRYSPMPDQLREELARRLPVREGDQIDEAKMTQLRELAREIDEHIGVGLMMSAEGGNRSVTINFTFPPGPMETSPDRIRVGGNVQANNLIQKAPIKYPPLAKQARIQGTVRFTATIGKDGTVKSLEVVSGHPLLVEAAQEGVQQWVYRPTLLNGNPVEVITQVDVNFSLQGEPPPPAL